MVPRNSARIEEKKDEYKCDPRVYVQQEGEEKIGAKILPLLQLQQACIRDELGQHKKACAFKYYGVRIRLELSPPEEPPFKTVGRYGRVGPRTYYSNSSAVEIGAFPRMPPELVPTPCTVLVCIYSTW